MDYDRLKKYFEAVNYEQANRYVGDTCEKYQQIPYYDNSAYSFNRLPIYNNWYGPKEVIKTVYVEKSSEARRLTKEYGYYQMTERNGRTVKIGMLNIKNKRIVNQHPDLSFDVFTCVIECDGVNDGRIITIPYKDFSKHNILPYIPFFRRNADCPDKYITMAFFHELSNGDDISFLQLPSFSGWQEVNNNTVLFAHSGIVIPQLEKYYSKDIIERKLMATGKSFADTCETLANLMPSFWKYKLLLAIRVTSTMLKFYEMANLHTDHLFVVETEGSSQTKECISILKNKNFNDDVCSLISAKTFLQNELTSINDGIALFRDSSLIEENKRREKGLETLLQDLYNCADRGIHRRHIDVIISDTHGNISPEIPAFFINMAGCPAIDNLDKLQQAIGELDFASIKLLEQSDVRNNLVTNYLSKINYLIKNNINSDYFMTLKMLLATTEMLFDYKIISEPEKKEILNFIISKNGYNADTDNSITNEFSNIISKVIEENMIEIANQKGTPYFEPSKHIAVYDGKFINITAKTLTEKLLPYMKTTQRRNKLLSALNNCGKLYSNNNYKRNIDVEIAPGVTNTISAYSFTIDILTEKAIRKLNMIKFEEVLLKPEDFPESFIPIVSIADSNKTAGYVVNDEAGSIYISGRTRSGKTKLQIEQALIRAQSGDKIIVFDQTGAFSPDELERHRVDTSKFLHWDIGKYGIPIDLLSLENCSTLPEKKNRLYSIYSVAARITGEVQGKALKKALTKIANAIDSDEVHTLLETLRFFDENDSEQGIIKGRLEEVFNELEGLNTYHQNWGDFLDVQKGIVVLSTSSDGIRKSSTIVDMLLSSLYEYKQHDRHQRYTLVLDEIEDLCLEKDGPINTLLRKGAKHLLSMILASQEYSIDKDKLGKLIGNCSLHVFFRPKDANIADISKYIGVEKSVLASLEQGQCVVYGPLFNKIVGKNKHTVIIGFTFKKDNN